MKATTKTGRVLAALAIGSLFVAACGSDDEAADTATEATEAPAEESEPEVVLASEECAIPVSADAVAIDVMGWEFPIITQYAAELKECGAANYSFNIQFLDSAEAQNQINLDLETGAPSYEMVQGSNQFIVELANKGLLLPLNDLVEAARRVNGGVLDAPARLHHQDEVGFLAQTFNAMMRRMRAAQTESKATPPRDPDRKSTRLNSSHRT